MNHVSNRNGITLIEMAIVLVIIGVILATIFEAGNLINITRKNAVITNLQKYSQAYNSFKDKYHAPPGDFNSKVLNTAIAENCSNSSGWIDGDGKIENAGGSSKEGFCAWRQLAQAGFIDGQFAGTTIKDGPKGPFDATYYAFDYFYIDNPVYGGLGANYGNSNAITLGRISLDGNYSTVGFTDVTTASGIDKKMDDENPLLGKFFSFNGSAESNGAVDVSSNNCVIYDQSNATFWKSTPYNYSSKKKFACYIIYLMNAPTLISH